MTKKIYRVEQRRGYRTILSKNVSADNFKDAAAIALNDSEIKHFCKINKTEYSDICKGAGADYVEVYEFNNPNLFVRFLTFETSELKSQYVLLAKQRSAHKAIKEIRTENLTAEQCQTILDLLNNLKK